LEISQFFDFQDGRRPPSKIFKFLVAHQPGLICIVVPNVTKICKTVVEISRLTILKMAAVRHLGFFKIDF